MPVPPLPLDDSFHRLLSAIDKTSLVPVSVQLRGAIEYGIASGEIPSGARLPSVRNLAARLKLSPVTVSGVYAALQEAGHIEGRIGSGTFVADGGVMRPDGERLRELDRRIEELVRLGRELGMTWAELAFRVSTVPPVARRVRVLMLGTFQDATEDYAEAIRPHLQAGDEIVARTADALATEPLRHIDLVVAPRTMQAKAQALFPRLPVIGLTMIPNEATRVALAGLAPEAEIAAVSYFPGFLPIMRAGVARFAPHVTRVTAMVRDDPGLSMRLARADVLIHSTGADYLRAGLRPGQAAIEYRHTPDGQMIRTHLLPAIEACRTRSPHEKEPALEDQSEQLVRGREIPGE